MMRITIYKGFLFFSILFYMQLSSFAQNTPDLLALLDSVQPEKKEPEFTTAAFKNGHLINQHTIETVGKRSLDFRISHHFGDFNSGAYNAWGLDGGANIRLALDYSYDGRFLVGIGRSSFEKMVDGSLKYKILRQKKGSSMPLSMVLVSTFFYTNQKLKDVNGNNAYPYLTNRFSYSHELIVGRKFSEKFSLQLAPIFIHYNIVPNITDKNDVYALLLATRYKVTKRFAIDFETGYCLNKYTNTTYYNATAVGFEIETGGHVFQMFFTNSAGMVESQFVSRTQSTWKDFGIKLGFNISRVFSI